MAALGFSVTAEAFYALGASLPMAIGADQRYVMATNMRPEQLESTLEDAMLGGIIPGPPAGVTPAQAAAAVTRRLVALGTHGAADHTFTMPQSADVGHLVGDWLGYQGDDGGLWSFLLTGAAAPHHATNPRAHLLLVLGALTGWDEPTLDNLLSALDAQKPVADADALAGLTNQDWTTFFTNHPEYLPASTLPGSVGERIGAFLLLLSKFYSVASAPPAPPGAGSEAHPALLDRSGFDPIDAFVARSGHVFGAPLVDPAGTAQLVFPGDAQAQAWLVEVVTIVNSLWTLTSGVVTAGGANADALRFSIVEALFARGFTDAASISSLSADEFLAALTGTVAYRQDWAGAIWKNAGGAATGVVGEGGFRAVNADGDLVNCIPPPELSPLGPVEYLSELLRAGLGSTCAATEDPDPSASFGALLAARRGDIRTLVADSANLRTPLPVIDVVNECLEHLAARVVSGASPVGGGVVHDTEPAGDRHDPAKLLAAVPQHSSPAVPVSEPGGYQALGADFSAPGLPYDQPIDVCRTYLHSLGTTRFDTMRRFRADVTEFVLNPDPPGFDATRWRYPVRADIAREYLGITATEDQLLLETPIALTGAPAPGKLLLRVLYGFPDDTAVDADGTTRPWLQEVVILAEFLERTGLDYCEFLDLWRCGFVPFSPALDPEAGFSDCPPCCPDAVRIAFPGADPATQLARLAIFVRLWRRLRNVRNAAYTFAQLADICTVLHLFDAAGSVDPGFVRQLAAFQMLRDLLELPLHPDHVSPGATGSARTQLLGLWDGSQATPQWRWARDRLLDRIEDNAEREHRCRRRVPEYFKVLAENLDALSLLAGFDPGVATDTWYAAPTHTLRFVEVLTKLTASPFTTGDLVALFTADQHLDGEDPFPLPDEDEALDHPLELPDDDRPHSLWRLRRELLAAGIDDEEVEHWTWRRIDACLRSEFGYTGPAAGPDPLTSFATHFFPHVIEEQGHAVAPADRRYSTSLDPADTSPHMWNADAGSPFHYDAQGRTGTLWIELPLRDGAVLESLAELRQLNAHERRAVQDLYFQPRVAMAGLGLLLGDLAAADRHLVQEPDERRRWRWMVRTFLLARERCRVVARHLARHVEAVCGDSPAEQREGERDGGHADERAWLVLRLLAADENRPRGGVPWEDDSGAAPPLTWDQPLVGRAFQALLGLCGTGLLTELSTGGVLQWRDVSGPLTGFGDVRDDWNAPLPTVLPALELQLTPAQAVLGEIRNGLGFSNDDGALIGGGDAFTVRWSGVLLVEHGGTYRFHLAFPDDDGRRDGGGARRSWQLDLHRGQRSFTLLQRGGHEPEPDRPLRTTELSLRLGGYEIEARFSLPEPAFGSPEEAGRARTGVAIQYAGPDTSGELVAIPHSRLFLPSKDGPLGPWLEQDDVAAARVEDGKPPVLSPAADQYLRARYTSTLRDIRRTYQRAFKGILLARLFELSAVPSRDERQSELGYFLAHPDRFAGAAYYRDQANPAIFHQHLAGFDLDFLPVLDPYLPPTREQDDRVQPTPQRRQALVDWWERLSDYVRLRRANREAVRPPLWRMFQDASDGRPDDPPPLTPHMDVDVDHTALVTTFLGRGPVTAGDLLDERWALRVWEAEVWAQRVQRRAGGAGAGQARAFLWASDDPSAVAPAPAGTSGNADLTSFVRHACLEFDQPHRYADLQALDDQLRLRARSALLAFLCGMDRVQLPAGWTQAVVRAPRDLSDLLLIDVEVGLCERATRIEDAVSAVQAFVQRIRLGLEPPLVAGDEFLRTWDSTFASFRAWQACRRRLVYRENWIEWDELDAARREEGYRFLEALLRQRGLDTPLPAGLQYWSGTVEPPGHPGLPVLQVTEPSRLTVPSAAGLLPADAAVPTEGFGLLGIPDGGGSPSWLAPVPLAAARRQPGDGNSGDRPPRHDQPGAAVEVRSLATAGAPGAGPTAPPLWIEAAIRVGTRFLRVAAAGEPAGSSLLLPRPGPSPERDGRTDDCRTRGCCSQCGTVHPPTIDEYYFWLIDCEHYDLPDRQIAELAPDDPTLATAWEDPRHAPALLEWKPSRAVALRWCRVHNGQFGEPRRCSDPVLVAGDPTLELLGRVEDSLVFRVVGGEVPQTCGGEPAATYSWTPPYAGWTADAGFRYDLAVDDAVALPLIAGPVTPGTFAGLPAYPFFVYGRPGAPLIPYRAFAPAMAVAGALRARCRFDAALHWYDLVFDPSQGDNAWALCPAVERQPVPTGPPGTPPEPPPPGNPNKPPAPRSRSASRAQPASGAEPTPAAVAVIGRGPEPGAVAVRPSGRTDHPCCPDTCPTPAVARHRAVTLAFLDTLLQLADAAMAENSPESFARARVAAAAASRILGPTPETVILGTPPGKPQALGAFTPLSAPLNPRLLGLYERAADLLSLLHHCDTRARLRYGRERDSAGWWLADPAVHSWQTVVEEDDCDASACHRGSPYRFTFLVQRALDLAGEVRGLGASLLSAFEKGDAEYLAALRAVQEHQLLELALSVRKDQWRDADWQVQALQQAKISAQTQVSYYTALMSPPPLGLNSGETTYESLTEAAMGVQIASQVLETIGQVGAMMPDVFADGVATGVTVPGVGKKFTAIFHTIATAMGFLAQDLVTDAQLNLTQAGWERRWNEWSHLVDIYDIEIKQIQRQILGAERRASQALKELDNQQRQIENAAEVDDFLRDKFTSDGLYLWLQRHTAGLYRQLYDLAMDAALQAQRAYNYERGHTAERFIQPGTWSGLHEGMLAGERLELDLRRMEKAYADRNLREYELTRHVSLRLDFPIEYLRLRRTGVCEISIPEWLFDRDYPGQYMRRIRSVSLSLPAVVGPYTGVHCKLTLLRSLTRVDPCFLPPPQTCCTSGDCRHGRDCAGYAPLPDDPRVVQQFGALQAIATSSGQADSGMFELDFKDQRYLPFEFAGAVSTWRIELPPETNAFDLDSLSDVVIHLNYTAREGGDALRGAAARCAQGRVRGDGVRILDARVDLADKLRTRRDGGSRRHALELDLELGRRLFPYLPGSPEVHLRSLCLVFAASGAGPGEHRVVRLFPAEHRRHGDGDCSCAPIDVTCVRGEEAGGLFAAMLAAEWLRGRRWVVGESHPADIGVLAFPPSAGDVDDIFLFCGYAAVEQRHA